MNLLFGKYLEKTSQLQKNWGKYVHITSQALEAGIFKIKYF